MKTDKVKEVLMFGFESQDFVNDLIGKERLDQAAHQLNQMLIEAHSRGYSEGLKSNKGDVGAAKQLADLKAEKEK